jgi:type II secretory pathway pseudopilin PulG
LLLAFAWLDFVQTIALVVATSAAVVTLVRTSSDRRRDERTEQFERVLEAILALRLANAEPPSSEKDQVNVPRAATRLRTAYLIATADGTRLDQNDLLLRFETNDDQAEAAQLEVVRAIEALRRSPLRARANRLFHRA